MLVIILAAASWALFLRNKLPASWYEGDGFASKLVNCELCLGFHVSWLLLFAHLAADQETSVRAYVEACLLAPLGGALALVVQRFAQAAGAVSRRQ